MTEATGDARSAAPSGIKETGVKGAPPTLVGRYGPEDLDLLDPEARRRFVPDGSSWEDVAPHVAFEILYRKEPQLYDRLVAGEQIHPDVIEWLPSVDSCVEIAAGSGRLTQHLAARCRQLVALEPAEPLRRILEQRLPGVDVRSGYFDDTGLPDACADLVVSCSAFTADPAHGGDQGLRELERIAAPGGTIAFVWPSDAEWLIERGFTYETYEGAMAVRFGTFDEAVEMTRIFYPDALEDVTARGSSEVPFEVLGMNPPRDVAWKRAR